MAQIHGSAAAGLRRVSYIVIGKVRNLGQLPEIHGYSRVRDRVFTTPYAGEDGWAWIGVMNVSISLQR